MHQLAPDMMKLARKFIDTLTFFFFSQRPIFRVLSLICNDAFLEKKFTKLNMKNHPNNINLAGRKIKKSSGFF